MTRRMLSFLLTGLLLLGTSAVWLAAQEESQTFQEPQDAVLKWVGRACLVVSLLGIGLLIWLVAFRRDRLMEAQSKWILFLGLVMLPIPVAFLNGGLGLEGSKDVEFCHSCHAPMDPFVNDMENPESDHLAAVHFKNRFIQHEQCWTCHSDYGLSGTAEAKLTGLTHIYKFTTNTWEPPIKLYEPTYNWTICLGCHAQSQVFQNEESHEGVVEGILAGEVGCTDCHETAHPAREERSER